MEPTNQKKKILIGEDEPLIIEHLISQLKQLGHEVVGAGRTEAEIMQLIRTVDADVILLDINIGGGFEGINIGKYIYEHVKKPFIYITAHSDPGTLKKALHTRPGYYIVKPFKKSDLIVALELVLYSYAPDKESGDPETKDHICVKVKGKTIKIALQEILFLKAEGNYTMVFTLKGRYLLRGNLMETLSTYTHNGFFRIHKSFAIQVQKITSVGQFTVNILGEEIPLGRTYRQSLLEKLNR